MNAPTALLLLTTAHRLAIEMTEELRFEHVSAMGLLAVQIIGRKPCSPRVLASALGSSREAATQLVGRLVRDGFVERTPDPSDGRGKVLRLTLSGQRNGVMAAEALERCMTSFTSEFSAKEKASLHSLLARLEGAADWHRGQRLFCAAAWSMKRRQRPKIHVR